MPLLVALDEYDSAIQSIAAHAHLGLGDPGYQESALRLILAVCQRTDETVEDVLKYVGPGVLGCVTSDLYR
ncbi:hypothetical protein KVP09_04425 [Alcaligenaceae bacterium CGII-47]|nr:hypothetical protein [Alcaligenaceae bacterium CGII-47]